jgi:hypothetical protein
MISIHLRDNQLDKLNENSHFNIFFQDFKVPTIPFQ